MRTPIRYYSPGNASEPEGSQNQPSGESHADNYDPENAPNRHIPTDGPSGENTKNEGERGGGLWTSGGQVTTGNEFNDGEYGTPEPNYEAKPKEKED